MSKKILMVLTSHAELGNTGEKTGFWVEEFAAPYYAFVDAGVEVTLASPAGGQPPIDPTSTLVDFQTDATKRYDADSAAQTLMANTKVLSEVKSSDFDAVFYPGGHGPLWDLVDNTDSISLIESFVKEQKPVAAVCHASAAFLNVKDADGNALVAGKKVTGFTNSEEAAVQLTDIVPFLVEDELIKKGGDYQKTDDWGVLALVDGLVITGQNPASSELAAKKLLTKLG
ncbi:type 1 glutamine amidotransferase domain-containing protein [Pseudoalteromonas sp. NZS127_1]|uniref:type 1 glutamine amidotransferase domain-containing protein n=1 Tax=Pseudoalteromonas TaxID=53246 RepID=UPI0013FDDAE9|nr:MULTISPECIES: type 1 glutamine amidotransferase domain-containing protein [Pseudoalteromonas]MBG9995439.1 type 1 glutamine amidotransferase domain-containing protein [Pseudoalteromonas sp. NZS127_1]MBH0014090.1 type 1 glutamine amidotransferase domain-containing protein [Pseudoalteromonas sp. NZS100_1]MBH0016904.1 type 1 glutamine amidotransferase domain-containing protein [Pseudoalteromonas sp. NGC95]MBH0049877.1 type 1 glutamine amidotransferase domain-containing protein [Pseudoalteromonas